MAIKLEKTKYPAAPEIKIMEQQALLSLAISMRETIEKLEGYVFRAKKRQFGQSSERSDKCETRGPSCTPASSTPTPRAETKKKLSERYPSAIVKVEEIGFTNNPCCPACGAETQDSGMTEDSEYLTSESKEYIIVRQKRQKNRCHKCHGSIITAPNPNRVIPGGSYSDVAIIDVTLTKYCDLVPIERFCEMAARSGLVGLPPHSMIAATMKLAEFMKDHYNKIKSETLRTMVLHADETPHRMLEGDAKNRWFLWAFSSKKSCFFECHDTRSGDVSAEILKVAACQFLLTDVYAGYSKSVDIANKERKKLGHPLIQHAYCNAHARRYFKDRDSSDSCPDAEYIIELYKEIYKLNKESKGQSPKKVLELRAQMRPIFEEIRRESLAKINTYSNKSAMYTAYNYFLKNYEGLSRFLAHVEIEIDNNHSERLLRNHVVGRKTWYGTHSKRAAETAAIHFTIVESCKMVGLNPREYYADAVKRIHQGLEILTPFEFKMARDSNTC